MRTWPRPSTTVVSDRLKRCSPRQRLGLAKLRVRTWTATTGGGTEDQTITISDFTFDPSTLTVSSGQDVTIEVTNNDDVEHSFTLDDDSVSEDVEGGESQTVTLNLTEGRDRLAL